MGPAASPPPLLLPDEKLKRRVGTTLGESGADDVDGLPRELRVPRVGLDDCGAPRGQRGDGVAADNRKREREVARGRVTPIGILVSAGEVEDRPERHVVVAKVRATAEDEVIVRLVNPHVEIGVLEQDVDEEAGRSVDRPPRDC
ncbi:hypothetical protein ACNKF0_19160 [Nocardioides sp. T5]|uniref:hypothetical protein n=1 Tax=Nocardioides sp. T5 TaxID=3400182 RepID=UPI003A867A13